jgi:2-amino-4-hydroxy-6-hydroxymethyldihydropteridine diphosphokinase
MTLPHGHRAWIAIGSNIEPERYLPRAVDALRALGVVARVSRVYESVALGDSSQANYLNAAVLLETSLSAEDLCRTALPAVEAQLDRVRDPTDKYAPRTIDLDLVLFDDAVFEVDHRRIPDPEIESRPFLSVPLAELTPEYRHPVHGLTLEALVGEKSAAVLGLKLRPDVWLAPARPESRKGLRAEDGPA